MYILRESNDPIDNNFFCDKARELIDIKVGYNIFCKKLSISVAELFPQELSSYSAGSHA